MLIYSVHTCTCNFYSYSARGSKYLTDKMKLSNRRSIAIIITVEDPLLGAYVVCTCVQCIPILWCT